MILVDTNIIIDLIHDVNPKMHTVFRNATTAFCGVVEAELLHGTRNDGEVSSIYALLDDMAYIDVACSDWKPIGFFLRTLREHGLTVPLADAIISYLAIKHDIEVWTRDRHFALIKGITPELRLFDIDATYDA